MEIKIIVATHKKYWMPEENIYLPIQVGAYGKEDLGFQRDDTGDHISTKNKNYCELTGLYWAWKNLHADYIGLVHYRRHLCLDHPRGHKEDCILKQKELLQLLEKVDVILPKPRNYLIETNYSQYVHAHHKEDLDITRKIIEEKAPSYTNTYDQYMERTVGHRFNMFIMKKDILDAWCAWLFDILFELEKQLDISQYSENDARVFGFVSERLLDIWLEANGIKYEEMPYVFMEKRNWIKKGANFLSRKLRAMLQLKMSGGGGGYIS